METESPAVRNIYAQTSALSVEERENLMAMILEDLVPEPPNTIHSREHLVELLLEGMDGEPKRVTEQTWEARRQRIAQIAAAKQKQA